MPEPIQVVYQADSSVLGGQGAHLLQTVRAAGGRERDGMLQRCVQLAQESTSHADVHFAGLALAEARWLSQAVAAFDRAAELRPTSDIDRLDAAIALVELGEMNLALLRLAPLVDSDQVKDRARRLRDEVSAAQHNLDRERALASLQIAALRERISSGTATLVDRVELARLLLGLSLSGVEERGYEQALMVLAPVLAANPGYVEALEIKAAALIYTGDAAGLNKALIDLERIAPDSNILGFYDQMRRAEDSGERASRDVGELLQLAVTGIGPEADAALASLRDRHRSFPDDEEYAVAIMFAAIAQQRYDVAIELADDLAGRRPSTYELHFNLGQVYWMTEDPQRGRHHLTVAANLARDNQERRDVAERVALLSSLGDHG